MSMDGLALNAALCELAAFTGAKIDKVQQPERDALLLTLRGAGRSKRLLLSTHAEYGRIQFTEKPYENPVEAPAFCMLLRRRLVGGRLEAVGQTGLDRVAVLTIAARDELYDSVSYRLVVELMGKHSNIALVSQDGTVLDCIRHVGPQMSSVRLMLPGVVYQSPPTQDRANPFRADCATFSEALACAGDPVKALCARFQGLSRASVQAFLRPGESAASIQSRFSAFAAGRYEPTLLLGEAGEPAAVFPFRPCCDPTLIQSAPSLSEALDRYYDKRDAATRMRRHGASLRKTLDNHLSRAYNKLAAYQDTILNEAKFEQYRLCGELITANLHNLAKGQSAAMLDNYYETPPVPVAVALDPLRTPQENAQRYFRLYKKSRTARAYAERQTELVRAETAYLEGQLDNLEKCATLEELNEIRDELIREGYVRPERRGIKRQKAPLSKPMRYVSSDGVPILVGKNNRQNDELTLKTAGPEQYWLHTKNIPGSHVIVLCDGLPSEQTLFEAAQLAAYYSRARASASVPVDYTPRKYVKKPSGARPGMVVYSTSRTLRVTPDAHLIARLERQA